MNILVDFDLKAPAISVDIKNIIDKLDDYNNYVFSVQLDYREHNTIFYLNKVESIFFGTDVLEIKQFNGTVIFLNYGMILEYCLINVEDVVEVECDKDVV